VLFRLHSLQWKQHVYDGQKQPREILVVLSPFLYLIPRADSWEEAKSNILWDARRVFLSALEDAALACLFHCVNMRRCSFCGMWNLLYEKNAVITKAIRIPTSTHW
jgi:hypothetical protein